MRTYGLDYAVLTLAACLPLAAVAGAEAPPPPGVWHKHEYLLSYIGLTSHYSCEGIAEKVTLLLRAAGARDDLRVVGSCSSPLGGPSKITAARTTFYTLVPEPQSMPPTAGRPDPASPAAAPDGAPGAWKAVEFRDGTPSWLEAGDCELVELFDRELLPFFTTRNHKSRMACVPHDYQLGAIDVRFEAFAPLPMPRSGSKHAAQ